MSLVLRSGSRKLRRSAPPEHGDPVRVSGHVGGELDQGGTFELHGEEGHVVGANPHYVNKSTGEPMTSIRLENGAIAAVPTRALKVDRQ